MGAQVHFACYSNRWSDHVQSESVPSEEKGPILPGKSALKAIHPWLLKGMGNDTLIGLSPLTHKIHPGFIKRLSKTPFEPFVPGAATVFPTVKLLKVELDTPRNAF